MPLAAAIFDMDGLLVDSEPVWRAVEVEIFGRLGVPVTPERCVETKGMFLGEAVAYWYARHPWPEPSPGEVAREIVDAMAIRLAMGVARKPGVAHALSFCRRRGVRLALASSSPRRVIDAVVEGAGLSGSFAVVHSAEDEAAGKPDPAVFLTTARLLGVAPTACVVFEDSPAGVRAAKAAGMACVAVPEDDPVSIAAHGGAASSGFAPADVVLASLAELDEAAWAACATAHGVSGREAPAG